LELPSFAALQIKRRDLIKRPRGVLQEKPTRAAGEESKSFCFPFCSKFLLSQGALQAAKVFVAVCCVRLPCSHFLLKCERKI
jgi:hypothetical protein